MREPQERSQRALNDESQEEEVAEMTKIEEMKMKAMVAEGVQINDVRVPRKKEEVVWRLAYFLRHETHIIRVIGQKVWRSWKSLEDFLKWTGAITLEEYCG